MNNMDQTDDYEQLRAEVGGQTTKKVFDMLQNQDHVASLKERIGKSPQTIKYHIEKLQERDLVKKTNEFEGRVYYKTTEKGEVVLSGMNIPEY